MELYQPNGFPQMTEVEYFDSFPPGYRFRPTEYELILYYLKRKVNGLNLPPNKFVDVNIYDYNPRWLSEKFRPCGEKEWYFFSPRNKKYRNGSRPNRAAGDGFWKATGADKPVLYNGEVVGFKKALVFYTGRPPRGDKTNWIMHEFRVLDAPVPQRQHEDDMKLDNWVLCKIYYRNDKSALPKLGMDANDEQNLNQNNKDAADEEMEAMVDINSMNDGSYLDLSYTQDQNHVNNFSLHNYQPQQQQYLDGTNFESYGADVVANYSSLNLHFGGDDWITLDNPKDDGLFWF